MGEDGNKKKGHLVCVFFSFSKKKRLRVGRMVVIKERFQLEKGRMSVSGRVA
jgi:hypothetical protein